MAKLFGLFELPKFKLPFSSTPKKPTIQPHTTKAVSYGGNNFGTDFRSGGAKWVGGLTPGNSGFTYDHQKIRNNARISYQDSLTANGVIERFADTIADSGLRLDSAPNFKLLGISPESAEAWARDVETRFNLWASDKRSNRSETMNFYQSHRLFVINQKRDGENFIRFYYSKDQSLLNPLQFEFIDAAQIRGEGLTSTLGPYAFDDGIERDGKGREKAYKIWVSKFVDGKYTFEYKKINKKGPKSGLIMMTHSYDSKYAGQQRGISALAPLLQDLTNLTDYIQAKIRKAINQSNIVMTIENQQQDPGNPTEDMELSPPGGSAFGVPADEDCDPTGDGENTSDAYVNYHGLPEVELNVPGSTAFFSTKQGDKIKPFETTAENEAFESFSNAYIESMVSSMGMSLSVFKIKFSSSFSAARGELLLFYRKLVIERKSMKADYLDVVFEMWLVGEISAGRVRAPGFSDPIMKQAWLNNAWIGAPMPNIDPLRTAKADKEYLGISATTPEQVAMTQNGSDAKMNMLKNKKSFAEMPIPYWEQKKNG